MAASQKPIRLLSCDSRRLNLLPAFILFFEPPFSSTHLSFSFSLDSLSKLLHVSSTSPRCRWSPFTRNLASRALNCFQIVSSVTSASRLWLSFFPTRRTSRPGKTPKGSPSRMSCFVNDLSAWNSCRRLPSISGICCGADLNVVSNDMYTPIHVRTVRPKEIQPVVSEAMYTPVATMACRSCPISPKDSQSSAV